MTTKSTTSSRLPAPHVILLVRSAIRSSHLIVPKDHHERLFVPNYDLPELYGQIKIHKLDHPIRPVWRSSPTPVTNSRKYLAQWFYLIMEFQPTYTIKNTYDFVAAIKNRKFPEGSHLVSFDISNMFSKIPVTQSIQLMTTLLQKKNIHPEIINEFSSLIKVCLICVFKGLAFL